MKHTLLASLLLFATAACGDKGSKQPTVPPEALDGTSAAAPAKPEGATPTPATPAAPAAPAAGAQLAKVEGDGFTVSMPGAPQTQTQTVQIPQGEVTTTAWTSNVDGVVYSTAIADYPAEAIAGTPPAAVVDEAKMGLVNQLQGTVTDEQEITIDGHPGKSFTITSGAGEVMGRSYLVGNRLYTMVVLHQPGAHPAAADAFLESLVLKNPPAPPTAAAPAK